MKHINVGIAAKNFYLWDGGIDFIATIAQGLENDDFISTFLLLKEDGIVLRLIKILNFILKEKFCINKIKDDIKTYNSRYEKLKNVFRECTPNTIFLSYKGSYINDNRRIMKCIQANNIEILLPYNSYFKEKTPVPWIGYMYDFQHEYLPELFDGKAIKNRKKELRARIKNSQYIIVNAKDVENDIRKFYPNSKCTIFSLPFAPFQKIDISSKVNLNNYDLPEKYYMISNQFWRHKNHLTAFYALEKLYNEGNKNIHLLCSGKLEDSRNFLYIEELLKKIEDLNCKENIHLLGYLPKSDQMAIMKNAVGLIQPTLCEGGPGGGSVYNALSLGITCLVSDIKVNREIIGYDNVYFFSPHNFEELAHLMLVHYNDTRISDEQVERKIEENKKIYCDSLVEYINKVIQETKI